MTTLLLLPEKPISVLPTLATNIGLNEAIALQQLHYWLVESDGGTKFGESKDGKTWVYNNYDQWKEKNFPFWSVSTIRRIFASLERQKLVNTRIEKGAQFSGGRRKWYTVNYETVYKIGSVQIEHTVCSEWTDGSVQNEPSLYTETTSETTAIAQQPNGAAQPPTKKPKPRKPVKVKTLADLDQLHRVIAINAHRIKPDQGITGRLMIQINVAAREIIDRFTPSNDMPEPTELAAAYKWHASQNGNPAIPKDGVKTGDMVEAYREAMGKKITPAILLRLPKHPSRDCKCEGTGQFRDEDTGKTIPCPYCLAAEDAALAAEEAADEAAA